MNKTVILIGGKFHLQRVYIDEGQSSVRMPIISDVLTKHFDMSPQMEKIKYIEYRSVYSIFIDVIPNDVFLETTIDPVDFLRNLVLDYTK